MFEPVVLLVNLNVFERKMKRLKSNCGVCRKGGRQQSPRSSIEPACAQRKDVKKMLDRYMKLACFWYGRYKKDERMFKKVLLPEQYQLYNRHHKMVPFM